MNSVVTQRFVNCHDKLKEEDRIRSSRQFALSLNYLPQSLSEVLKGRRDVTIELLRKAVEKYNINPVYIYTGSGPMFMKEEQQKNYKVLTIVTNPQSEERIVHVPSPVQEAYASAVMNPGFIKELPTYSLPDYQFKVGTFRSFDVCGDAMDPLLVVGDKVICSFIEPTLWANAIKTNHVYAVVTKGSILIKRILNKLNIDKQLELVSDNEVYEPIQLSLADVSEIWQVRAKISPFLPNAPHARQKLKDEVRDLKQVINQQSKIIHSLQNTLEQLLYKDEFNK